MKKFLAALILIPALAFGANLTMLDYFDGKSSATLPLGPSDKIPIVQGGAVKTFAPPSILQVQYSSIQVKASNVTGQMVNAQIADAQLTAAKFAQNLTPIEIVGTLPYVANFQGRMVFLTTDNKLYRYNGSAWTAVVPATDVTGQLADSQIAAVAAAKVTGQLSDAQIAAVAAAKVTGQITSTQITDGSVSTPKLAAGAVTADQIGASAVTAGKIAANAVTATEINAGAVTTAKLAAGAVTATEIASGAVITAKLAAGAVTANELAANAVTAGKISAGAVTATELAANAVTAGKIATGTITATDGVIASIDASKITTGTLDATNITVTNLSAESITTGTLSVGSSKAPYSSGESDLRILRGRLNADGTIAVGAGFTTSHSIGYYTLTFAEAFNSAPTVVATLNGTSFGYTIEANVNAGNASFYINAPGGAMADRSFSFIIVGN